MAKLIFQRLLGLVPVLLGVSMIIFAMIHLLPGNPVRLSLGFNAPPSVVKHLEAQMGLNLPLWQQYLRYIGGLLHLNLGVSMQSSIPVSTLLGERLPATAELALSALCVAVVEGVLLGTVAAYFAGRWPDRVILGIVTVFLSVPSFWLGIIFILVFAVHLGWFPVFGYGGIQYWVLPASTLGLVVGSVNVRIVRSSMVDVLSEQYIRTAIAKGLSKTKVVLKHALRNALIPATTVMGLQLGTLLGGAVIIEQVFGWPGLGSLMISAIERRDYTVIQGAVLYLALIFVLANLLVDLLYVIIDPRISYQ